MPMNVIPLFLYDQLNAGPLRPQAAAWNRQIPLQLIVDYADHQFLDILLAMRHSWDTVPIALLRRELEYVLGTISALVALEHIVMLGPIVQLIGMLGGKHQHHAEQPRQTKTHFRPTFYLQRRSFNVWRHGENSYQKAKMMSTLEVVMNDRMMDIAAHGQEATTLFDIYEAIIYKEANNVDEAETQQNTTELDDEIQCILDNNKPAPEHMNQKKATKAMEDLRRKNHTLIDLINKVAHHEGPDLSLEEVFTKFHPVPDVGSLETHNGYFKTLPSGSERSGDTLDQAAKIRNAQFPHIFNLQPLTPIEPKDDGDILHITLSNRPHDRLALVFQTPKLSKPLYVPSGSDTPKLPIIPVVDVLESDDEFFQSLGGTSSSIIGKKLASGQALAQPSAGSASGSDASLSGESAMEYKPHSISWPDLLPTSDDEVSLGGELTEDLSSDDEIADDHPHIPHHASLVASDDEASLGGQSTKDPSSNDEMANDESMKENTPGVDLSRHKAKDDEDDGMSLGSYTDDEADNLHTFSMVEMQANMSNIPSSPEVGCMGSPIDKVDDTYSEYSDDSDGDVNISDDVRAYLQTSHTPGFQYAEFADDVL
ncbi:hypothetical protein BDN71DRAFT_1518967 [Pleurotus eryngii]|uniref:Uncharacterized protein n=1 Tax=Pleurotus eryngii TaxID=5323 RepID=A0A9P5ZP92_PLEER|nr:hypothetical protein BDN71DRAFT_1518967 [Pleurotus eryngii]